MSHLKKMSQRGFNAPSVLAPLALGFEPSGAAERKASRVLAAYFRAREMRT
jgi:hypothetical protein